jgi:molybdopterin-guanine dinucleotide biosynthesis protein A
MRYRGKSFAEHLIAALQPITKEIIIVTSNKAYAQFALPLVNDIYPNCGPIGGLHAGLLYAKYRQSVVVSCDTPLLQTSLLQKVAAAGENVAISVATIDGRPQPTVGCYDRSCADTAEQLILNETFKMSGLMEHHSFKYVPLAVEEMEQLTNVNTPHDFELLK